MTSNGPRIEGELIAPEDIRKGDTISQTHGGVTWSGVLDRWDERRWAVTAEGRTIGYHDHDWTLVKAAPEPPDPDEAIIEAMARAACAWESEAGWDGCNYRNVHRVAARERLAHIRAAGLVVTLPEADQ